MYVPVFLLLVESGAITMLLEMTRLSVEIAACLYFYSGGSSNCENQLLSASVVIGKFVKNLGGILDDIREFRG